MVHIRVSNFAANGLMASVLHVSCSAILRRTVFKRNDVLNAVEQGADLLNIIGFLEGRVSRGLFTANVSFGTVFVFHLGTSLLLPYSIRTLYVYYV